MESSWLEDREWRKEVSGIQFFVSTTIGLLDHEFINTSFGTEDMYWAKPIPPDQLAAMLSKSATLGLYEVQDNETTSSSRTSTQSEGRAPAGKLQQIGLARFATDHITMAYLTDVYVLPEYRKLGLGRWLIACCKEFMDAMPAMRRGILMTSPGVGKNFYSTELGWYDIVDEQEHAVCMTKRFFEIDGH